MTRKCSATFWGSSPLTLALPLSLHHPIQDGHTLKCTHSRAHGHAHACTQGHALVGPTRACAGPWHLGHHMVRVQRCGQVREHAGELGRAQVAAAPGSHQDGRGGVGAQLPSAVLCFHTGQCMRQGRALAARRVCIKARSALPHLASLPCSPPAQPHLMLSICLHSPQPGPLPARRQQLWHTWAA